MNKYPLIGGSICAVVLLVLASLTNVVGFQTVQSSNQKMINTEIDQKELLFQTIVDMANNKEIQRVILGSELTGKRFFDSGMRFPTFKVSVVTKQFLERIYTIGVILFRTHDKSKIQALSEHSPIMSQGLQKKLSAVIEKDSKLNSELNQLSNFKCDCEGDNMTPSWYFFILCGILMVILSIVAEIWVLSHYVIGYNIVGVLWYITVTLNCWY